jgi:hypothetical protein
MTVYQDMPLIRPAAIFPPRWRGQGTAFPSPRERGEGQG